MLQQRDHIIGKRTSLFFGIASAFLLAYIGARFFKSLFAGLLAALIFLSNNITIPAFQQVLVDSMCVFFSLLTLIILAFLLDRIRESDRLIGPENKRALLLSVLLGFAMSLALGIKPVTLPVLAVFFSAFALSFVAAKRRADRLNLFASFTVAIISFCMVFILLFPTLWLEPLTQLGKMAQFRNNYMTIQNTVQEYPISSHQQRMDLIIGRGIFLDYELSDSTQIFYAFALLTGLYHASKKAVGELRTRGICGYFFVFLSWCIFTFLINGINQNMNWTRYYIPYVACASMMLALGVSRLSKLAHKKMKQYSPAFIRRLLFSHLI